MSLTRFYEWRCDSCSATQMEATQMDSRRLPYVRGHYTELPFGWVIAVEQTLCGTCAKPAREAVGKVVAASAGRKERKKVKGGLA